MLSDYYEILELTSTANATQIKAAYKRLAMQYHPDRNMGDKQAEEMFKRINEAYHILSDPLKKSRYDRRFESNRPAYAEDHIQREYNRKRYYQTHQPRPSYYKVDKNYFKIQGLAILVFFMFAGLAFGIAHTVMYFVEKGQMEEWVATTKRLKQVNGLFEAGRFNEAFDMVTTYKQQYPTEFRFTYAKDSLITALGRIAEATYEQGDYKKAVEHLLVLRELQNPVRENTLKKIAWCQFYLGNYDEALRAWKHLYNQKPENFELVYLIGMVNQEKLGNKEEALQYYDLGKDMFKKNLTHVYGEAFEIVMDPRDAPDIYYELFIGRAKVNIELQHYQEAIKDGNWAIFLRRAKPEGYYLRAMAKINAKISSDLCEDIRQARQSGSQEAIELQKKYCH